jgi:hypothetical protein
LLKNDSAGRPVPEFTNAQKEVAKNALRERFRVMLDKEIELKNTPQTQAQYAPQYVYEAGKTAKNEQTQGNMIAMLYSGTPEQQQAAVNYFMGLPGVTNVTRDDNGVSITRNGETKPIPFINEASGNRMSLDEFVRSSSSGLLGEKTDVNNILKGALGMGSKNFQFGTASASSQSTNPNEMYGQYVSNNIPKIPTNETKAVAELSPILNKLGFTVEEAVPGFDYIVIKNKDGVESSEIKLSDPKAAETIQSFLLGNVPGKDETERAMYLNGLSKKGVFGQAEKPNPNKPKVVNPKGVGSKY